MPAPRSHRNLLPSTNAALKDLEAATGQPVTLVEDPELSVAATMRRARESEAIHILSAGQAVVAIPRWLLAATSALPISFSIPEATFDLSLLPEPAPQRGTTAFREAVTRYYKDAYREAGGRADVAFCDGQIEVSWDPGAEQRPASETITEHLEDGRYEEAIPLLEATLQLQPDDVESLAQLGMVKSDLGELVEARRLLERAVALDPAHVNALVSLGVAALRAGDPSSAQAPLEEALALSPGNPYALRALGQAQLMRNDPEAALPFLRLAADTPPADPITLYALAQALMALDTPEHRQEPDTYLTRALALGPPSANCSELSPEAAAIWAGTSLRGPVPHWRRSSTSVASAGET
jgi:Flp pilus assembly protein TadD